MRMFVDLIDIHSERRDFDTWVRDKGGYSPPIEYHLQRVIKDLKKRTFFIARWLSPSWWWFKAELKKRS